MEGEEYEDYELPREQRESIKSIQDRLDRGLVTTEKQARDYLDYLEIIDLRCKEAVAVEQSIGRVNLTLKHDMDRIAVLMRKLQELLRSFD